MKSRRFPPVTNNFLKATNQEFPTDDKSVEIFPQKSISECFQTLNDKKVDYAIIPFENSTNGQVVYTYDLLRDWFSKECSFRIVAEQFVAIHHCVLTRAKSWTDVKRVYSHPQVWGQVTEFAGEHLVGHDIQREDVSSTSRAAELVYEDKTNTTACISSSMSADIYNLPTMFANIEDIANNTTRFLVLGYDAPPSASDKDKENENASYVTSMLFTLNHDDSGALCTALDILRKHDVNLTSINSRPSHLKQWQYVFFAEVHGNLYKDENVKEGLKELADKCQLTILGSFKRNWRYYK